MENEEFDDLKDGVGLRYDKEPPSVHPFLIPNADPKTTKVDKFSFIHLSDGAVVMPEGLDDVTDIALVRIIWDDNYETIIRYDRTVEQKER